MLERRARQGGSYWTAAMLSASFTLVWAVVAAPLWR